MANWYVSSVAYTAVAQWAATHTYAVGAIVRQLAAPATNAERCFRASAITTGISGGAEPAWVLTNNATTTDGGVTWTECTGQEAHQHDNGVTTTWTAPAARHNCLSSATNGKNVLAAGDTTYFSSDHAETLASATTLNTIGTSYATPSRHISVSRTGSVPPAVGDLAIGASIACTSGNFFITSQSTEDYWYGITFDGSANTTASAPVIGSNDNRYQQFYESCTFKGSNSATTSFWGQCQGKAFLKNCTISLTNAASGFTIASLGSLTMRGGSVTGPGTSLFSNMGNTPSVFCEGVDLSTISGTLVGPAGSAAINNCRFYGCKLNASVLRLFNQGDTANNTNNSTFAAEYFAGYDSNIVQAEFVNCSSGNDLHTHHWFKWAGYVQSETSIILSSGGATDGTTPQSRKLVSNSNAGLYLPLWHDFYVYNSVTGVSKTASLELISSGSLNNNDLWLEAFYAGDVGDNKLLIADSYPATPLTAGSAIPTSTTNWAAAPPTPVKQLVSVSFTPQKAGLVRIRLALAKPAITATPTPR